ncbi:MAG: zinc ribbon domain-containing protein [candidate division WOR-3 bacterium]
MSELRKAKDKSRDSGTNVDSSQHLEYCCYCYQVGKFTELNITMEELIEKCANIMREMKMSEVQIEQTKTFIPMFKRWRE